MSDFWNGIRECWPTAAVVAMVLVAIMLLYRGVRAHIRSTRPERTHELHEAIREVGDERERLRQGLQRILRAPDPLEAFIDALSGSEETGRRRR
jgi:hypothetical protein